MNENKRPFQNDSGFTLIEVMIVTALLAIGAGITAFSVRQVLPDLRLKAAVRELKSDMQFTRLRAIRENATLSIVFDTANETYSIINDDGSGGNTADDGVADAGETVFKRVAMPLNVNLNNTDFPAATNGVLPRVQFNALGMPIPRANGVVTMSNSLNLLRRVNCSAIAQLRIDESTDGGSNWKNISGGH